MGSVVPFWQNTTKVRPNDDTDGPNYNTVPFPRQDVTTYNAENPHSGCGSQPKGYCGTWLIGGDLLGVSTREVTSGYDDINPTCGGTKVDHNCYVEVTTPTAVTALVASAYYTITVLETTTQANWNTIAGTTGVTYSVGDTFLCASGGTGTGTATQVMNMVMTKRFGGQWILAQKWWHGMFGFVDQCDPNTPDHISGFDAGSVDTHTGFGSSAIGTIFNNAAPQTKYLQEDLEITLDYTCSAPGYPAGGYGEPYSFTAGSTSAVGQKTGITTTTGFLPTVTGDNADQAKTDAYALASGPVKFNLADAVAYFKAFTRTVATGAGEIYLQAGTSFTLQGVYTDDLGVDHNYDMEVVTVDVAGGTFTRNTYNYILAFTPSSGPAFPAGVYPMLSETLTIDNTQNVYDRVEYTRFFDFEVNIATKTSHTTLTLSAPYSSTACYADFFALLNAWNMSDFTIASLRTDSASALAPLVIYDEVLSNVAPLVNLNPVMNDYSVPYDTVNNVWATRPWLDPNTYLWEYNGEYASDPTTIPDFSTAGPTYPYTATLVTSTGYGGSIIAHTQAGSDRHFWFGAVNWEATPGSGFCDGKHSWFPGTHGAFSDPALPATTKRWMDTFHAQYDVNACGDGGSTAFTRGNYPQAFIDQFGGQIRGAKFCQATQTWPSLNRGRPCGPDKYAVDQTTVCCIGTYTAFSTTVQFTVATTGEAIAPVIGTSASPGTPTGGLISNDYILAEGYGTYKITIIASAGTGLWLMTCTSIIDALPTGYVFQDPDQTPDGVAHLGRLRFTSASGICGRAAITTAYDSGTGYVKITSTALPYLRIDPSTGSITVDLYDSTMTALAGINPATIVRATAAWQALFSYPVGSVILDSNGNVQVCTTAGMTGSVTPTWNTSGTTADAGTLVWTCYGNADENFIYVHAAVSTAAYMTGHGVDWTKYTSASKHTGVHLDWTFNARAAQTGYTGGSVPDYAGQPGCIGLTATQFTYPSGSCIPIVGIVPGGSPENFNSQVTFNFPSSISFDENFGAHWQAAVMLTIPDPLWQKPFKPDCSVSPDFTWAEDSGDDPPTYTDGDTGAVTNYFAHHPLVEATTDSTGLPTGIYALYDLAHNAIAPPYYPNGIPCDGSGDYVDVETDWGFAIRACITINAVAPFSTSYLKFVTC